MARNWSIILISLERLVVVAFPLNYKRIWNSKTLGFLLFAIIVTSIFSNWNHFVPDVLPGLWQWPCLKSGQFAYTIFFAETPVTRFSVPRVQYNDVYLLYVIGTVALPYLMMCVINTALVVALNLASKRRKEITTIDKSSGKDVQILKMVGVVLAIFFICEAPAVIERLEGLIRGKETPLTHEQRMAMRKFALALSMFDSVVNFFAYCAVNRSFKQAFVEIFKRNQLRG
ncbi:uncharacterized protein LOC141906200 [Tubulanus polymorphus]|uniref:uncharacterized protein LOC141906200 n=1 Tax=Tubulanus polymorphus TaxID=672921 RepID=UPI003DA38595